MGFEVPILYRKLEPLSSVVVERKMAHMKAIHIRAIGKPTEAWQTEAVETYLQRLKPFSKVDIVELKEGHGGSAKPDADKTRKTEAESLLKSIPDNAALIALDETGHNLDSIAFARKLDSLSSSGQPLVFLIGGSWGLDKSVRDRAVLTISFGKQTLPHNLARIVLLEQLYRAATILSGKEYHK
jgi:23S rRNA (pseudouridine1915-N3)-methyltransferase